MDEKSRLHIRYIVIIAIIITLGSLVLAGYDNQSFVGQFSFASTITSIVLSVVAIWMSISGERTTNEIKTKIIDATDRLDNAVINVQDINKTFDKSFKEKVESIQNIHTEFSNVVLELESVKSEVVSTKEYVQEAFDFNKITLSKQNTSEQYTDDEYIRLVKNIQLLANSQPALDVLNKSILYVIETREARGVGEVTLESFIDFYRKLINVDVLNDLFNVGIIWSAVKLLNITGLLESPTAVEKVKKILI
ncbi:hypothetical protein [Anaerocolumna chitinilytica]|uniref:Uncharacterized protein n=1 Tax=Anaerocolumna chitinilytica TaxID=1727145 RepID=A0A7I8DM51_9FIRM|nr:hypothetical protein [Anaerocolumna chitinilytica]BCJ98095.1 hypothetical protein bsdcttw_11360 [Anaerocolumna chitinilytica]